MDKKNPCLFWAGIRLSKFGLSTKVVKENILRGNTKTVEHIYDSRCQHRRSTHQVEVALGLVVCLQIVLVQYVVNETYLVLNTCCICCGIGTVQSQVELEVGELLLDSSEILQVECLLE